LFLFVSIFSFGFASVSDFGFDFFCLCFG
jgi:hypothetical protein